MAPRSDFQRNIVAVFFLSVMCAVAFSNSLENSFHFDDEHSILKNPHIRELENIPSFFVDPSRFSRNVGSEMYRPLVLVSYALNYRFSEYNVGGYHLVNLAIHAGSAIAFYFLLLQLGTGKLASLVAALVFASHPLTTEPVNYISSRSESLAAFFFLVALYGYVRKKEGHPVLSYCCYGLGLLAKSTVIGLPALLFCYDHIGNRAMNLRLRRLAPYAAIAVVYLLAVQGILREAVMDAPLRSFGAQLATQLKAIVYYATLIVSPFSLSVEHQFFEASAANPFAIVWPALGVVSLVMVLTLGGRQVVTSAFFWIAWIAIVSLPTFVVPLNVLVNERRLYLVLAGAIGLAAWLLSRSQRGNIAVRLSGMCVIPFFLLTVDRNNAWATEQTLWLDAQVKAPLMTRPLLNLGRLFRTAGEVEKAERVINKAVALEPESSTAWGKLALVQMDSGRPQLAEASFRRALELQPGNLEAQINLATLLGSQDRLVEALALYRAALARSVNREETFNNMGTTLLRMNRFREAERAFRRALAIDDRAATVHFNLGGALEGQDRFDEAEAAYLRAIDIDPSYAKPYYNLALLMESSDRLAQAVSNYRLFLSRWHGGAEITEHVKRKVSELGSRNDYSSEIE